MVSLKCLSDFECPKVVVSEHLPAVGGLKLEKMVIKKELDCLYNTDAFILIHRNAVLLHCHSNDDLNKLVTHQSGCRVFSMLGLLEICFFKFQIIKTQANIGKGWI